MISRPCRFASFSCLIAVFVSLFLAARAELRAATITASSVSFLNVSAAIASAADGDTVIIPAGTATWTSQLIITNGITLIGQTTTDSVAGTAVDSTVIVSKLTADQPLIAVNSSSGKAYRVSGLTFQDIGTVQNVHGVISLSGESQSVRVDHCDFQAMPNQSIHIEVSDGVYGVADHNIMLQAHTQSFHFANGNAGSTDTNGNAAWAAATNWGGSNFFFAEDNYIKTTTGTVVASATDGTIGCRFVFRHNHCYNTHLANHGTEGQARGARAQEIYNNDFHMSIQDVAGGLRSGSLLFYNNTWDGTALSSDTGMSLQAFRTFECTTGNRNQGWFAGDGSSPWDVNDTEGNLTYVPGHTPFLYFSGTATTGTNNTTIVASSSPNWSPNKWVNFGAKKTSATDTGNMSIIAGNTSNTLTVNYTAGSGGSPGCTWVSGDTFEIHRILVALDQSGRGQGDLVTGPSPNWINNATGTAAWPHQVLDPVYGWSNRYTPANTVIPVVSHGNTFIENRDYYNEAAPAGGVQTIGVGIGILANRPASGIGGTDITGVTSNPAGTAYWATDVASANGSTDNGALYVWKGGAWVLYYQPYTYPHPLVSGVPGAPTNLRVVN